MPTTITAADLEAVLRGDGELALIDVREEGVFGQNHLLMAVNLPLSGLELSIRRAVPRRWRGGLRSAAASSCPCTSKRRFPL